MDKATATFNFPRFPWRETLLIFFLMLLALSMNYFRFKPIYARVFTNPWIRFFVIFMSAYLLFSMNLEGNYSVMIKIVVSAIVTILVDFLIRGSTILTL